MIQTIHFRRYALLAAILCSTAMNGSAQSSQDTLSVYFDKGASGLNRAQKDLLDSLWYHSTPRGEIRILAYTDRHGRSRASTSAAAQRAAAVRDWLLASGFGPEQIGAVETFRAVSGHQAPLRVDVIYSNRQGIEAIASNGSLSDLGKLKANASVELNNLIFFGGEAKLLPQSVPIIDTLHDILVQYPGLKIHIEGHVCCGKATEVRAPANISGSYELSNQRAERIYHMLLERGIQPERLSYEGMGFSRPKYFPEKSIHEEKLNRRVEIRVVSQ